jgi:hypothetical protein
MGLEHFDPLLRSHRMVLALKRDTALRHRFEQDEDGVAAEFGLTPAERDAIRARDFRALYELGLHPYYLSQLSRLIFGTAAESRGASEAARALVESFQRPRS